MMTSKPDLEAIIAAAAGDLTPVERVGWQALALRVAAPMIAVVVTSVAVTLLPNMDQRGAAAAWQLLLVGAGMAAAIVGAALSAIPGRSTAAFATMVVATMTLVVSLASGSSEVRALDLPSIISLVAALIPTVLLGAVASLRALSAAFPTISALSVALCLAAAQSAAALGVLAALGATTSLRIPIAATIVFTACSAPFFTARLIAWTERRQLAATQLSFTPSPTAGRWTTVATGGSMPQPLFVLLLLLLVMPVWSVSFLGLPWQILADGVTAIESLTAAAYWALPPLLAGLLLTRKFLFLPLFVVECGLLAAHALLADSSGTGTLQGVRLGMLGAMIAFALLLATRDFLFPFMSRGKRGWRAAPRVHLNAPATLVAGDVVVPLVIQNCSLTGIALHGDRAKLRPLLKDLEAGAPLALRLRIDGRDVHLPTSLVWRRDEGPAMILGVHTRARSTMERFLAAHRPSVGHARFSEALERVWARTSLRRAAIAAWAVSIAGAFGMPACEAKHPPEKAPAVAPESPNP